MEQLACSLGKLKSIADGDATLLDRVGVRTDKLGDSDGRSRPKNSTAYLAANLRPGLCGVARRCRVAA